MPDFREALDSGRVILLDGAMGTEIYRRGVFINRCFDDLSRTDPNLVREVHTEYRRAGAQVLETNTFGANRFRLQGYGLEAQVSEVNAAAVGISAVIQPGGSIRDEEVIEAADEHGMAMVFTSMRHFRH